jgi:hypothetical protein
MRRFSRMNPLGIEAKNDFSRGVHHLVFCGFQFQRKIHRIHPHGERKRSLPSGPSAQGIFQFPEKKTGIIP